MGMNLNQQDQLNGLIPSFSVKLQCLGIYLELAKEDLNHSYELTKPAVDNLASITKGLAGAENAYVPIFQLGVEHEFSPVLAEVSDALSGLETLLVPFTAFDTISIPEGTSLKLGPALGEKVRAAAAEAITKIKPLDNKLSTAYAQIKEKYFS